MVLALFMYSRFAEPVRNFLMAYSIPSQMISFYGAIVTSSGPSGWGSLGIITGITAVALGGAYLSLKTRDV